MVHLAVYLYVKIAKKIVNTHGAKFLLSVTGVLFLFGCHPMQSNYGTKSQSRESASLPNDPINTGTPSVPKNPVTNQMQDGVALYTTNCAACHGSLGSSTKIGRTESQISLAITNVPTMIQLKSVLNSMQIQAIAAAISGQSQVAVPSTVADQLMFQINKNLFSLSMKYFAAPETLIPKKRIFRLTRQQLDQTAKILLPMYYKDSIKSSMASDPLQTNYEYADVIGVNQANFTPLTNWIQKMVEAIRLNSTGVINCASQANSESCLKLQGRSFIIKALRGSVEESKIMSYLDFLVKSVGEVGLNNAVADFTDLVLSSPQFLFRYEFNVDTNGNLTASELLQTLTYTVADALPEELGMSSSNPAVSVGNADLLKNSIDKLVLTKASRDKLQRFFLAWLEVKDPNDFTISTADFPLFTPQVAAAVVNETNQFLSFHLSKVAPNLKDITQATSSFIDKNTAAIYDLNPSSITTTTGTQQVGLDVKKRLGIFSQSAVIASHSGPTSTRLVKRGVFFVRKVMCMDLGATPPGVDTTLPPLTSAMTERSRIESVTNKSQCLGCHSVINPYGFSMEKFDAIGKWRLLDNSLPIDTNISINTFDEGDLVTNDPIEALKTFTNSARFKQCFVRQLFRYYMGRNEEPSDDPVLRQMNFYFSDGDKQDIFTLLKIMLGSQRFTQRGGL